MTENEIGRPALQVIGVSNKQRGDTDVVLEQDDDASQFPPTVFAFLDQLDSPEKSPLSGDEPDTYLSETETSSQQEERINGGESPLLDEDNENIDILNTSADSSEQYVPESLSSFVRQAATTFQETTKEDYWKDSNPRRPDPPTSPSSTITSDDALNHNLVPHPGYSDSALKRDRLSKNQAKPAYGRYNASTELLSPDLLTPPPNPHHAVGVNTAKRIALQETEENPESLAAVTTPSAQAFAAAALKEEPCLEGDGKKSNDRHNQSVGRTPHKQEDIWEDVVGLIDSRMSQNGSGKKQTFKPLTPPTSSGGVGGKNPSVRSYTTSRADNSPSNPVVGATAPPQATNGKGTSSRSFPSKRLSKPTAASRLGVRSKFGDQKTVSVADGVEAARARVQQWKLREQEEKEKNPSSNLQSPLSFYQRPIRMSPEEGQARARARVKIRQELNAGKDKENATNKQVGQGTSPSMTKSIKSPTVQSFSTSQQVSGTPSEMDSRGANPSEPQIVSGSDRNVHSRRSPTVPVAPTFRTAQRAAERAAASSASRERQEENSLSSRSTFSMASKSYRGTGVLRKDDQSVTSSSTINTRRSVTIPQAPRFTLDIKYGDKAAERRAMVQKEKDEYSLASLSVTSGTSWSTKRSITVPQAPKFALDARYGEKKVTPTKGSLSLAQCTNDFAHSLRSDNAEDKSTWHKGRITVPVAPKFHTTTSKRAIPKSTEEQELEMMQKFQKFKARPMPSANEDDNLKQSETSSKRKLTVPVEFKFNVTSKRELELKMESLEQLRQELLDDEKTPRPARTAVPRAPVFHVTSKRQMPKSSEELEQEELQKQFRARPMPDFNKPHSKSLGKVVDACRPSPTRPMTAVDFA